MKGSELKSPEPFLILAASQRRDNSAGRDDLGTIRSAAPSIHRVDKRSGAQQPGIDLLALLSTQGWP
jgi:hypothetical protein